MQQAKLENGDPISNLLYDKRIHGDKLYCPSCKAEVIFVRPEQDDRDPFFKTTGFSNSKHTGSCDYVRKITKIVKTMKELNDYTYDLAKVPPEKTYYITIDIPLNKKSNKKVDTLPSTAANEKKKDFSMDYPNSKKRLINNVKSLKSLAKLLHNSPEKLSEICLSQGGKRYALAELVLGQNRASEVASQQEDQTEIIYYVYGIVRNVIKLTKVTFVNFDTQDGLKEFAGVVFPEYYPYFTYTDEELRGQSILVAGNLQMSQGKTQMRLYGNSQLYVIN